MIKQKNIEIKGARVHNLKNIDLTIPRNKLIVVTGLSGSGKSSLAFDTLYAEGQRRYVESLSSYARQFLGRMAKPEVDYIKGIPPAIAIEQKVNTRNPRSTVGTSTEVYDYIKLLYARIGKTHSPVSGREVKQHSVEDVLEAMRSYPPKTKCMVLSPILLADKVQLKQWCQMATERGFTRAMVGDKMVNISALNGERKGKFAFSLLVDRLTTSVANDDVSRFADSLELAFQEGEGRVVVRIFEENGKTEDLYFSNIFEADGLTFEQPTVHLFSFNSPLGACPYCEGFGKMLGIDEDLVIPNKSLSLYEDCVICWRSEAKKHWKQAIIENAEKVGFPIHRPYFELNEEEKALLWEGSSVFGGINTFFAELEASMHKIQNRVMLARFRGKTTCPHCKGKRLKKEATYVKVAGKSITDIVELPLAELYDYFVHLPLTVHETQVAKRLLLEIKNRLSFLLNVGLGYLTLNRLSNTLSGGESQRINLATSLGSSLVGSLYILDEPSIGLHPRDTERLIGVLLQLRDIGNTIVVVEHDEDIMRSADYIIDIGPEAGSNGGEVIFQGSVKEIANGTVEGSLHSSYTLKYLTGGEQIALPTQRRKWSNYVEVEGACDNNLKNLTVKFPLEILCVVTGVSGSGKTTLVKNIFYTALNRYLNGTLDNTGKYGKLNGSLHLVKHIEYVDQNPIGRSSRSNPVTYIKAYDEVRRLFASQQLAKQLGFTASHFSFNIDGGRCPECQGEGTTTVEMQFMADLVLECEHCHGKRFKSDVLEVTFQEKNIDDVLNLTVDDAISFFEKCKDKSGKKIVQRLKPLQDVGLGYVKLGQSSSTLSGGESQRVKLASFLSNEKSEPTVFVFDEPTTGLHFHDIKTLLRAFDALIMRGHTLLVIEHNTEIIKCADHIIDLGAEGGEKGGNLVFEGTPEDLAKCSASYTGRYLKSHRIV